MSLKIGNIPNPLRRRCYVRPTQLANRAVTHRCIVDGDCSEMEISIGDRPEPFVQ